MPIRCLDLDGMEPLDYSKYWEEMGSAFLGKWGHEVKDVYDQWTEKVWSVMSYPNHSEIYYWKNNDGREGTFDFTNNGAANKDKDGKWNGYWQRFEKQETIQSKLGIQLSKSLAVGVFGIAAIGAALPVAANLGAGALLNPGSNLIKGKIWSGVGNAIADVTYQLIKGGDYNYGSTLGNFLFSNPLYSALPGAVLDKLTDPTNSFLTSYGRGILGDAIGNIPVPSILGKGMVAGLGNFTLPLVGNLVSDVTTGKLKEEQEKKSQQEQQKASSQQ